MRKSNKLIQKLVDELSEVPNISIACKKIGISRQSLYRWMKEDPEVQRTLEEAMNLGREAMNDLAESVMWRAAKEGNITAAKYILDNNKKNYIKPRPKEYGKPEHVPVEIIEVIEEPLYDAFEDPEYLAFKSEENTSKTEPSDKTGQLSST